MKNPRRSVRQRVLVSTAAMLAVLGATACEGSKEAPANVATAEENVVLPEDESRERHHEQGMAAEMHNQMSAAEGRTADGKMGAGGMMDDDMPMTDAMAKDSAKDKPMPKDTPMPMEDDPPMPMKDHM